MSKTNAIQAKADEALRLGADPRDVAALSRGQANVGLTEDEMNATPPGTEDSSSSLARRQRDIERRAPRPDRREDRLFAQEMQEKMEGQKAGFFADVVLNSAQQDWMIPALPRLYRESGFETDPTFDLPSPDEAPELWEGVAPEDVSLFYRSRSAEHFKFLRDRYDEEQDSMARAAPYGWGGIGARLAVSMLDPVSIALAVGTGGSSLLTKASALERAVKLGLLNAGANTALIAPIAASSHQYTHTDTLIGTVLGGVLGGAAGGLMKPKEIGRAKRAALEMAAEVRAREVVEAAAQQGRFLDASEVKWQLLSGGRRNAPPPKPDVPEAPPAPRPQVVMETTASRIKKSDPLWSEGSVDYRMRRGGEEWIIYRSPAYANGGVGDAWYGNATGTKGEPVFLGFTKKEAEATLLKEIDGRNPPAKVAHKMPDVEAEAGLKARIKDIRRILKDTDDPTERMLYEAELDDLKVELSAARDQSKRAVLDAEIEPGDAEAVSGYVNYIQGDSVGAAKATSARAIAPEADDIVDDLGQVPKTSLAGGQARSYNAVLNGHEDPFIRSKLGSLVADTTGPERGTGVSVVSAEEIGRRKYRTWAVNYIRGADKAFEEWLKGTGKNVLFGRFNPKLRDEWATSVGRAALGIDGNYHPSMQKFAAQVRKQLDEIGDELVTSGVLPEKLADYRLPTRWNHEGLESAIERFHVEQIEQLFATGIAKDKVGVILRARLGPDADAAIAALSKGFVQRVREVGRGMDVEMMHGVSLQNVDYLGEMIVDAGGDAVLANRIVDTLKRQLASTGKDDAGLPSIAKHRLKMDYNTKAKLTDKSDYSVNEVSIADLMETNTDMLMASYLRGASGRVGIAEATGMVTDADFKKTLNLAKSRLKNDAERTRVENYATDVWNLLVGRPIEGNPNGFGHRWGRNVRNYNMARMAWSFGVAQIADLGNAFSIGGFRGLILGMDEIRRLISPGQGGKVTRAAWKELEEIAALGLEHQSTSLFMSEYADLFTSRTGRLEFALRGMGRAAAVGSGMAHINRYTQLLAGRRIVNELASGRKMSEARLAYLGFTPDEASRVSANLRKFGDRNRGNSRIIDSMHLEKWPQQDAALRAKFIGAVRRGASRAMQENDIGGSFPFMHRTWGKVLSQFRTFSLLAHSKQTLHLMNMRDGEAFANMTYNMMFGALSYLAYTGLFRKPEDWDEMVTPGKIATAGFSRSGMAGMIPPMVDTMWALSGGSEPLLGFARSTGLPSDVATGSPSINLADRAFRGASNLGKVARGDKRFTENDLENLRRISPIGNMYGAQYLSREVADTFGLPER